MALRLLLATLDAATLQYHEKMLMHHGVDYDATLSREHLLQQLSEQKYNGILIDEEFIRSSDHDTFTAFQDIVDNFPFLKIKKFSNDEEWSGDWKYFSKVDYFINQACKAFQPRHLRFCKRYPLHFNVLLNKNGIFSERDTHHVITSNISEGGCFILFTEPWHYGFNISFRIMEFDDNTPITGEIRWHIEWGMSMRMPGLGIRFKTISDKQTKQLKTMIVKNTEQSLSNVI